MTKRMLEQMALPVDFQEVLIWNEMRMQSKISAKTIRRLADIYTLAMEFYHLQSDEKFELFYRMKLNELLGRPEVISCLDRSRPNLNRQSQEVLFPFYDRKDFKNGAIKHDKHSPPFYASSKSGKDDLSIKAQIIRDLSKLEEKTDRLNKAITTDVVLQLIGFESKKNEEQRKKEASLGFSLPKRNSMQNEIEKYVEKNMDEMYKALDKLKESYEIEIKEAEDSGYPLISSGLQEDLSAELENLKLLYEEQRVNQTESIRQKYLTKHQSINYLYHNHCIL